MKQLRQTIIRAGLETLSLSGAHRLFRTRFAGVGTIFMLHHVRPARPDAFQPNRHLEITPEFLRTTLEHVRQLGIEIVSMDEMHRRMQARDFSRRFACFTFDDGYRDNRDHALPIMRAYEAPFTVYVASDFASHEGRLWWVAVERLVARCERIEAEISGETLRLDCATSAGKAAAYGALQSRLQSMNGDDCNRIVADLCARYGVDEARISAELCMSWDELAPFAADPLVTIGAHTISHCNLAKAAPDDMRREMVESRTAIQTRLGLPADHFAYPYGDRSAAAAREFKLAQELGFKTAVTTRPGMLFAENAAHMMALPRLSLNGNFQQKRLLPVLTSGAATAMWNGFRRVDAA